MGDQLVGLFEGAFVEQELDALARRHLALLVFARAALCASAGFGEGVAALQFGQLLFQVHGRDYNQPASRSVQTIAMRGSRSGVTQALGNPAGIIVRNGPVSFVPTVVLLPANFRVLRSSRWWVAVLLHQHPDRAARSRCFGGGSVEVVASVEGYTAKRHASVVESKLV